MVTLVSYPVWRITQNYFRSKMDKFDENFHHTQPVEFYDDINEGSLRNLEKSTLSEVEVPNNAKPDFSLESYGKMITPKSFDGKTDPRLWIHHYEVIAEANLWDDDMKARRLIASLDGAAQHWFMNQRLANPNIQWKLLKEKLINRFSKSTDRLIIVDSDKIRLKKIEDFDKYWEEKLALFKLRSPNMSQKEMMQKLFDGLNKELKSQVLSKIVERKAETAGELHKLIKEIIDIEQYKKEMESSNKKKSENYHKSAELDNKNSEIDLFKYKVLKRNMDKIKEELKELKGIILNDLLESQAENDEPSQVREDDISEEEEDNERNARDKIITLTKIDEESESNGSDNEDELVGIFKENDE